MKFAWYLLEWELLWFALSALAHPSSWSFICKSKLEIRASAYWRVPESEDVLVHV